MLEPVARALDVLQGEKNNSQGWILPILLSMRRRISQIEDSNNIVRDYKSLILRLIDVRFGSCLEINVLNKDFILSAVSLPRFKTNFIGDEDKKSLMKALLVAECKKFNDEKEDELASCEDVVSQTQNDDDFIISYMPSRSDRRSSINNKVESEVSQYLLDPRLENEILDDYKYVRAVFYKHNTTLSSSAPVERVFSQSLMIFTPRRNRISPDTFEKVLVLKHNRMLLKEK